MTYTGKEAAAISGLVAANALAVAFTVSPVALTVKPVERIEPTTAAVQSSTLEERNDMAQSSIMARDNIARTLDVAPWKFGDGNDDGRVNFADISATLSNWMSGEDTPPGQEPSAPPVLLTTWAAANVVRLHPSAIEGLESPEYTIAILRGAVGPTAAAMGVSPSKVGGMRRTDWPGGWPAWPPPGSAFEAVMDEWLTGGEEAVEAAAQAVLNEMRRRRAAGG